MERDRTQIEPERDPNRISWIFGIRVRIFVSLALLAALLLLVLAFGIERLARDELEDELTARLHAVGGSAITLLRPSIVPALISFTPEHQTLRTYQDARRSLTALREQTDVRRIFLADLTGRSFVDTDARVSIGTPLPQLRSDRPELVQVEAGQAAAAPLFTDENGQIRKTGYVPVLLDGRTIGVVGVEADATFLAAVRALRARILTVGVAGILLAVLLAALVARGLTRPLDRLVDWSRRLGSGDLSLPVPARGRDEIAQLARTLEQMRVRLESRDRELRAMVAGVAHEIRNPLGGMKLYTEMLAADPRLDPASRGKVRKVLTELDQLARIVEEFLLYARPASPDVVSMDAAELLDEILEWARPEAGGKGVTLVLDAPSSNGGSPRPGAQAVAHGAPVPRRESGTTAPEHFRVVCDPTHFRQVFRNLIRNAVEASPEGGRIDVSLDASDDRVDVIIDDQGPGLEAEPPDRVFEPFYTTKPSGSGLGLAIVQRLTLLNQGHIRAGRAPGGGARFTVSLPRGRGA